MAAEAAIIPDRLQRERALDPTRSFLVQAPAGSGKTELLIQRYLVLLAHVDNPESVFAITFTRKAAGEMRRRVLSALEAASGPEPAEPHKAATWRLARAVSARDAARSWGLADNPNRLRIRTIDSLGASITSRMPWMSRLGAQPDLLDDARPLYLEAARKTITGLADDRYGKHLERVLLHLDNDFAALEQLLAAMLQRRDQWLRHLAGVDPAQARPDLERALQRVVEEALEAVCAETPDFLAAEFPSLARHAANNLDDGHPIGPCANLVGIPGRATDALAQWLGIAALLLTTGGAWRRSGGVNKSIGFPTTSRQEKPRFQALLAALEDCEAFRARLHDLRTLPPASFDDQQWEVLESLVPVLMAAAAQLKLVFRAREQADFSEVTLAAIDALGSSDEPTDLALALDYRIEHLLVDEFQDTSITQVELLRSLTAGWEPGDGRTVFAVGDPMQSIYRFREAEVGLFLKAAHEGLGTVQLDPLRLSANFRSDAALVEWVNGAFPGVLAPSDDIATGAIRFSPSRAVNPPAEPEAVTVHPFFDDGDEEEARRVVSIVTEARATDPAARIAVLVRARTHLPSILRAMRRAGLRYRAVEIDQLGDVTVTQDLLALTRALLHPADRVSWLAVLRAPWCGLTLADLHALAADSPGMAVQDLLRDPKRFERLSADGRVRLSRILPVLETAVAQRGSRLRTRVEDCWVALGGPACAVNPGEAENALAFLDLLDSLDEGGDADIDALSASVDALFAAPDPEAGDTLEVMTIHKAKGLEFDVVILPGLGRRVPPDEPRLLAWLERPSGEGESDLLLAPVKPAGASVDALYEYVKRVEKDKFRNETGRLLYVAATRAKRRLHLLGAARWREDTHELSAPGDSLLAQLWPAVQPIYLAALSGLTPHEEEPGIPAIPPAPIRRLSEDWVMPAPPPAAAFEWDLSETAEQQDALVSFEWVGDTLRHIGTVVHRMLQQVAQDGVAAWNADRVKARKPVIEAALRTLGVPADEIGDAVQKVARALTSSLADERGRWILDGAHTAAQSEYAVTGLVDGRILTARVDRTFIDADGVRWIVDFKTSAHEGGNPDAFLDNELERYRKQMSDYAALIAKLEARPVRMGLYFPLLSGWREYDAAKTA